MRLRTLAASDTQCADPWKTAAVTVQRVVQETPDVWTYDLEFSQAQAAAEFRFQPGQFNMLYVPGVGEAAISIAGRVGDRGCLRHSIRTVGAVTAAIQAGGIGMQLGLRGPFGVGWPVDSLLESHDKPDVIIAAGGVGLAPLRALVEFLLAHRGEIGTVHLLVGVRTPQDLLYQYEITAWRDLGLDVHTTVDRPSADWKGHVGVVTLLLERLAIPNPQSTYLMTCGPEVMMRYVAKSAMDRGIQLAQLWVTLERNMNCAIGLCGHCQLGPRFLCKDGPVFRYDQVRDWLRVQDL